MSCVEAFSLVPDYLRTAEGAAGARNLMDTAFSSAAFPISKALDDSSAFWAARLRTVLREHIRLAHEFAARVDEHPDFERLAPVPFATCASARSPRGRAGAA
jgi:aromatic-L-amino-acid decarboxylase